MTDPRDHLDDFSAVRLVGRKIQHQRDRSHQQIAVKSAENDPLAAEIEVLLQAANGTRCGGAAAARGPLL